MYSTSEKSLEFSGDSTVTLFASKILLQEILRTDNYLRTKHTRYRHRHDNENLRRRCNADFHDVAIPDIVKCLLSCRKDLSSAGSNPGHSIKLERIGLS